MHRRPAAAVAVAALVVLAACSDEAGSGDDGAISREGSELVDDVERPSVAPVGEYLISYEIAELDGGEVRRSSAELLVVRPYRSRLRIDDGHDHDHLVVADFTRLVDDGEVLAPPPQPAVDDIRGDLLVVGDDAVETRVVADRTCWVHRFGGPLTDGTVTPGDTTDVCIDADGLLLEQVERDGAEVISRWVATSVDTAPDVGPGEFRADGEVVPAEDGGGDVRAVEPTSRAVGTFWELDDGPPGFDHRGRYAVVPPQDARVDSPETRARVIAGVVDVWERGIDVITVDQGGTLGQVPALGAVANSSPVALDDLGALGDAAAAADVFATTTGAELRVLIAPGRYVRIVGTVDGHELVAVGRSLRPVEGDGLVYIDG